MANRQQKRNNKPKPYNPVNTDKLAMAAELKEKLSLETLQQLEKSITNLMQQCLLEETAPAAERIHQLDWAIIFRVLIDQFGFGRQRLRKLFDVAQDYMRDVDEHRLNLDEMLKTLEHDNDIVISWNCTVDDIKELKKNA